jgi:hypothetical protein
VSDLSAWVAPETLVNLVLSVVQTTEDAKLRRAGLALGGRTLPPRLMLTLLTYAYAVGLFASQAIADRLGEDPILQYLSCGKRPEAEALRRFRRRNRETITQCLETVCLVVWKIRFGSWTLKSPSLRLRARGARTPMDPLIQMEVKCDVMDRLHRAELEDTCWLETRVLVA